MNYDDFSYLTFADEQSDKLKQTLLSVFYDDLSLSEATKKCLSTINDPNIEEKLLPRLLDMYSTLGLNIERKYKPINNTFREIIYDKENIRKQVDNW